MRYLIHFLIVGVILISSSSAGELRKWTGSNGKTIEAEFVSFDKDSETVHLRLKNGKDSKVKLSLFSAEDQQFVKNDDKTEDNPFGGNAVSTSKPLAKQEVTPEKLQALVQEAEKAVKEINDSRSKPGPYSDLAVVYALTGNTEKAKSTFKEAIDICSGFFEDQGSGWVLPMRNIGLDAVTTKYFDEAERCVEIVKVNPFTLDLICPLSTAFANSGNREKADKYLSLAVGVVSQPNPPGMAIRNVAIAQANQGQFSKALATIAKSSNPKDALAFIGIGTAFLKKGKINDAVDMFKIAEDQQNKFMIAKIAKIWIDEGKPDKALEIMNGIQDNALVASLYRDLVCFYLDKGDLSKAKQYIEKSAQLHDDSRPLEFAWERCLQEKIFESFGEESQAADIPYAVSIL